MAVPKSEFPIKIAKKDIEEVATKDALRYNDYRDTYCSSKGRKIAMNTEKGKLQTTVTLTYVTVFILFLVFAIYMSAAERNNIYQARTIEPCEILEDYVETTVEDSSAPVGIRKEYRWKLSDISTTKDYLAFYIVHHYAQVHIDGELVYSLTPNENNRIGASPSSNWIFIPLDQSDNGREIVVTVTPVYKSVINREIEFMIGARSDIILKRLKVDLPQIAASVLCLFIGIFLMIAQPILILRKKSNSWGLFYLGNFLLLIGVWRITDTRFSPIFFSANPMVLGYITLAVLFIVIAPLLLFIKEHFTGRKKTLLLLTLFAVCVTALIALICQVFKIAELRETLPLCHIMLVVCMAVILLVSLVSSKKDSVKPDVRGMVLLLTAGCIADLLFFYWKGTSSGVIFSATALLIYTVARFIIEICDVNKKVFIDAQTGLFNRSRWNDIIKNPLPASRASGVMMLDLNRLKYINDTMGHKMGDKMIFGFATILREVFTTDCMVFRWGGDEFTVLVSGADRDKMNQYVFNISKAVDEYNTSGNIPEIHYAVGYALSTDYPSFSYEELMKKADEKMYLDKSEWYQKNVPEYRSR